MRAFGSAGASEAGSATVPTGIWQAQWPALFLMNPNLPNDCCSFVPETCHLKPETKKGHKLGDRQLRFRLA
jgi:hypothetical protein